MKRLIIISFLLFLPLFAEEQQLQDNETKKSDQDSDIVKIKDTSGLSDDEIREVAKEKKQKTEVKAKDIIRSIVDSKSKDKVDISKIQTPWDEMSPTPKDYDWVRTKSGEWFKGDIKAMYNDKLEFDSDEMGLYTFDFKDVTQIKSYHIIGVNIEDAAIFIGIIRLKGDKITIIQGDKSFKFPRSQIISLAPEGSKKLAYWSGKVTLSIDARSGNKDQYDVILKANLKRRTSTTMLLLDLLGRKSSNSGTVTSNDSRFNLKYDRFITRKFFWTPVAAEYYQDDFKNIKHSVTASMGLGYSIIDRSKLDWDISGGLGYTYLEHLSVESGKNVASSPTLELSTKLDWELNSIIDFKYDYKLTFSNSDTGRYNHHMVATLENELTDWLDLDISGIWDYMHEPQKTESGELPKKNDFQILVGLGVEF